VAGRSVRREPEIVRRSLGYVPDRMPGWPGLRAGEFLEVFGSAAGLRRERLAAAVGRGLALAGLPAGDRTPLDALATGQQKRLLLARALLHEPDVLLLDDPFGGLDPLERLEMERFIGDALLMGRTVLAAIDDADVPACFTHLFVLAEGSLVASGPATPAAFSSGRAWRCGAVCRGAAERAVTALAAAGLDAAATDPDAVSFVLERGGSSVGSAVAVLAAAGIDVEQAGFSPPWPAQLIA
jgi:ABC-type multidrug transport system ATPase subunit